MGNGTKRRKGKQRVYFPCRIQGGRKGEDNERNLEQLKYKGMKKALFIAHLVLIMAGGICASCTSYKQLQLLNDYRRFVDYMYQTNEPFEVACETDLYTNKIQEDLEE